MSQHILVKENTDFDLRNGMHGGDEGGVCGCGQANAECRVGRKQIRWEAPVGETCLLVNAQAVGNSLALEANLFSVALDSLGPLLMDVVQKTVFCQ